MVTIPPVGGDTVGRENRNEPPLGMPWLAGAPTFVPPSAGDSKLPPSFGDVTKPMVLAVLSIIIISAFFLVASRKMKIVPSKFQFAAESFYDFSRNGIAREQIGGQNFRPYIPLI